MAKDNSSKSNTKLLLLIVFIAAAYGLYDWIISGAEKTQNSYSIKKIDKVREGYDELQIRLGKSADYYRKILEGLYMELKILKDAKDKVPKLLPARIDRVKLYLAEAGGVVPDTAKKRSAVTEVKSAKSKTFVKDAEMSLNQGKITATRSSQSADAAKPKDSEVETHNIPEVKYRIEETSDTKWNFLLDGKKVIEIDLGTGDGADTK